MSLLIYSQQRSPLTPTYIMLGLIVGAVVTRLYNISINSVEGVLIIGALGGFIGSSLFFVEPIEKVCGSILRYRHKTWGKGEKSVKYGKSLIYLYCLALEVTFDIENQI